MKTKLIALLLLAITHLLAAGFYIDEKLGIGTNDPKAELDVVGGILVRNESKSVGSKFLKDRIRFFTNDGIEEYFNNGIYSNPHYLAMHMLEKETDQPFDFIITLDGIGIRTPNPKPGFDLTVEGKSYSKGLAINTDNLPSDKALYVNGNSHIDVGHFYGLETSRAAIRNSFIGNYTENEMNAFYRELWNAAPTWASFDSLAYKPSTFAKKIRVYDFFELGLTDYTDSTPEHHAFCSDLSQYPFRVNKQGYIKKLFVGNDIKDFPTATETENIRLAVDGVVLAEEILVKKTENWPDYVFKKDYNLMPINELEDFVNENGHLPEVPNAKEVAEKGVSVGDMQKTLLKKVEELTKYVIEINDKNQQLEQEVKKLKSQLKQQ